MKKTLSPEQLEKLKIAREKALVVRQANAKNKALERELVVAEKEKHLSNVKMKLAKAKAPVIESSDADTESEGPERVIKVKKKPKKVVIVEDSESDDEHQQVIFVKRKKDTPAPASIPPKEAEKPPPTPAVDPYQRHYDAIFGGPRRNY